MDGLIIRRYKNEDFDEVWKLHILALKEIDAYLGDGLRDEDLKDIEKYYLKSNGEFLVGLIDNQIVAMGALLKEDSQIAWIKRMRVNPKFQGRGIGQYMLNLLEEKAKELGYKKLKLDTSNKQIAALKLYQKNNYQETKRKTVGNGLIAIYFEKEIT